MDTQKGLTDADFSRLSRFIEGQCGIRLTESKRVMLENRLKKRIRVLGIKSLTAYCDYLFSPEESEQERLHLVDLATTNKTDFFREADHFSVLTGQALPALLGDGAGAYRSLTVWSAACSTGEEPYTLAMVLSELAEQAANFRFSILATDISTKVLEIG